MGFHHETSLSQSRERVRQSKQKDSSNIGVLRSNLKANKIETPLYSVADGLHFWFPQPLDTRKIRKFVVTVVVLHHPPLHYAHVLPSCRDYLAVVI